MVKAKGEAVRPPTTRSKGTGVISEAMKARIAAATVRFAQTEGGQGVFVPGGLLVTAAHVIAWTHTGEMTLGHDSASEQRIEGGPSHEPLLVYPAAVEPVADLAILEALDDQAYPDAAAAFERVYGTITPVPLDRHDYPLDKPIPVWILTHEHRWIDGDATPCRAKSPQLYLEPTEPIKPGTSGSPVVTAQGRLLGVVSSAGGTDAFIVRVRWAAPAWVLAQAR